MWQHNELYHHGIKGQRWGVRNGPPYPIEDRVLQKGTRLNSVSIFKNSDDILKSNRWVYTFNPDDDWDSKVYKGPFSLYKLDLGYNHVYEHRFEVIKDLKMPTRNERVQEFIDLYKNEKYVSSDLKKVQKTLKLYGIGNKELWTLDTKHLYTREEFEKAYSIFGHAMENVTEYKSTAAYSKIMSKKYDAMVDDNNQGVYNDAHDPIIIFRAENALRKLGDARVIDAQVIKDNFDYVRDELNKRGKTVLL